MRKPRPPIGVSPRQGGRFAGKSLWFRVMTGRIRKHFGDSDTNGCATAVMIVTSLIPPLPFSAGRGSAAVGGGAPGGGVGIAVAPRAAGGEHLVVALVLVAFAAREVFCPEAGRCPAWRLTSARQPEIPAYTALAVAAVLGFALQFGCVPHHSPSPWAPWASWEAISPLPRPWPGIAGVWRSAGRPLLRLLPVATGLYLQCGQLLTEVLLYGLPLTFTAINLFLVYGFPLLEPLHPYLG